VPDGATAVGATFTGLMPGAVWPIGKASAADSFFDTFAAEPMCAAVTAEWWVAGAACAAAR